MTVTLKFDWKFLLVTAICISIWIAVLLIPSAFFSAWLPSNSSELASWVQAVGVISALAISIYLATLPRKQAIQYSVSQASAFIITSYKYIRYIRLICPGSHEDSFRFNAAVLREISAANLSLNYGYLPTKILVQIYEYKSILIMIEEFSKSLEFNKSPDVLKNLYHMLDEISNDLDEGLRTVINEGNKILNEKINFDALLNDIDREMRKQVKRGKASADAFAAAGKIR